MNREDIIRMAREAGLELQGHGWIADDNGYPNLERFAQLVAAAEREACVKVAESFGKYESDVAEAIRARGQQ